MLDVKKFCGFAGIALLLIILYTLHLSRWYKSNLSTYEGKTKSFHQYKNPNHDAIFEARQKYLTKVCLDQGQTPPNTLVDSTFPGSTIVETKHQIFYCPVQKVGSSFWRKTLIAIGKQGEFKSPFKREQNGSSFLVIYQNLNKDSKIYRYHKGWFMKNAVSLLVVRDPYSKIFSAYVDKLYHPNYLFWKTTGQSIDRQVNKNKTSCGDKVTFSDYIKYVINLTSNGSNLNAHFTPIYKHCYPCKTKYDFIMKFENFKNEYHYVLNKLNARFNLNVSALKLESTAAMDIASKHIGISFTTMKEFASKCHIPQYNFLLRTWRFLQITGVLPKQIDLPFQNNEGISSLTKEQVLDAVQTVLSSNIDWSGVKQQRHEALVQAYKSIQSTDMQKLQTLVKPDCQYFNYDEIPDYLTENVTSAFNYFDGI